MNEFTTSDTHFFHKNVIVHCRDTRLGETSEEADELLIQAWNKKVSPKDTVYHLGDFSFGKVDQTLELLKRLNGKIVLIPGNHDEEQKWFTNEEVMCKFDAVVQRKNLRYNGNRYVLDHYPIHEWRNKHRGWCHLHGHSHGYTDSWGLRRFDVGVDARPDSLMQPWAMEEIEAILLKRPIVDREHSDGRAKPAVQW